MKATEENMLAKEDAITWEEMEVSLTWESLNYWLGDISGVHKFTSC